MFGYSRNSGISWFRNYGDALHKYENTKDIRGRTEEPKRPLGHRKNTDMYSIVKLENGDIQCVLYRLPVVTFHVDNTVTVEHGGWASQTTANFIPEVIGDGSYARVFNNRLCLYLHGNEYFIPKEGGLKLAKNYQDNWEVLNAPNNVIHHINRKASKQVVAKYEEFFKYLERMRKLRHDGERAVFTEEEYVQTFGMQDGIGCIRRSDCMLTPNYEGAHIPRARQFLEDTSETQHESYYKLMLMLVNTVSWIDWHSQQRRMKPVHWEQAKNELKNFIWGLHRDKVFKEVPVPVGSVKRDTYGRFFESGWNAYHANNNVR